MAVHIPVTMTPSSRFPGGGGSRRDEAARLRILAATVELLTEVGYGDLTIEAVAARARVGKPTIYRWWANKAHLVYEASCATAGRAPLAVSGDLGVDLRAFVERVARFMWRDEVSAALRGMLTDPSVLRALDEDQGRPARRHLRRLVEAGTAQGAVRPGVDAEVLFDLIVGAIVHRALLPGPRRPDPEGWIDAVLDLVRHSLAAPGDDR
jgi:AcrR family transcriptional regulator